MGNNVDKELSAMDHMLLCKLFKFVPNVLILLQFTDDSVIFR